MKISANVLNREYFKHKKEYDRAALIRVKLKYIEEIIREKEAIANYYLKNINNSKVRLPKIMENSRHVWHQFVVCTEKRDEFASYLAERGIGVAIHYPIPPHLSEAYSTMGYRKGAFPITEDMADHIISLPSYNGMTEDEMRYVVAAVNEY